MGPGLRTFLAVNTAVSLLFFLSILAGCGGSSSSNRTATNAPPAAGAGGSGTNTGSTNTGSGGSGSSGSGSTSSLVSYVFTAGGSNVTAYAVNADGSLAAAPNSPYSGGTDKYVVTNGSNVYTIGSDGMTLKVYAIDKSNGSLTLANTTNAITGNTFAGDIVDYLSLDHTGQSLYIGEMDSSGDDGVNFWRIGSSSTVTQVQWDGDSEVFGPPLVWSPDNTHAYSGNCYHLAWLIFSYTRNSDGPLSAPSLQTGGVPPTNDPNNFPCPAAFAVSAKGFLAVAYTPTPQGGTYSVATYTINSDGSLALVAGSQTATASSGGTTVSSPIALNFDSGGTYLATAGNGGVQTFAMNSSGMLSAVATPLAAGIAFQGVAWDKSNHLFATSDSQLYVWNAANGMLSPASGSPQGGGGGLAVLPLQ